MRALTPVPDLSEDQERRMQLLWDYARLTHARLPRFRANAARLLEEARKAGVREGAAQVTLSVEALLEAPAIRAADGGEVESFVAVSALRAVLARGGCGDTECADCRTEWGRP